MKHGDFAKISWLTLKAENFGMGNFTVLTPTA